MRKVAMLFAVAILMSACSATGALPAGRSTWTKSWNISGAGASVRVETEYGTIRVTEGAADSVAATVTTRRWQIAPGQVEITSTQNGNEVELQIETPKYRRGWFHWHSGPAPRVHIALQVPASSKLDLHTGFGDIVGENLQADARVNTGFGKIDFPGFSGELVGNTGFGDVSADGRFDRLQLKTGFGNIRAAVDSGSKMSEDWRLSSGFGSLHVRVPLDLNADLRAHSGFGHVSTDLPLTVSGISGHSSVRGKLGSGGFPLELSTGFGSVHIGRT